MTTVDFGDRSELLTDVQLHFEPGRITMEQHRMVLLHSDAIAALRKELIDSLGTERARGLLTRHGFESGKRDAQLARRLHPNASDEDLLQVGPSLHTVEGVVKVSPVRLNISISSGAYFGEFIWEDSYEAEIHRELYGLAQEPVCWTLIGYATGYTSEIMGRFILYREVQCCGAGDPHCRDVGKPVDEWDDPEDDLKYFKPDRVADQLMQLQQQVEHLRRSLEDSDDFEGPVGESVPFKQCYELLKKVADSHVTVLLLGETGTGKEVLARTLHSLGPRADKKFVALNCAAIPEELIESEIFGAEKGAFTGAQQSRPGKFERAHGGTLFLDEVGELSAGAQAKLLRVLEVGEVERLGDTRARKVDVRVVAATNVDLRRAIEDGSFRADLYYRLSIYPVTAPPLRERDDDIELLAEYFLNKYGARYGKKVAKITTDALEVLKSYHWPGNVRELEHVIERGIIVKAAGEPIGVDDLFPSLPSVSSDGALSDIARDVLAHGIGIADLEASVLSKAIEKHDGNLTAAARSLGISRPQIAYRLKKHAGNHR